MPAIERVSIEVSDRCSKACSFCYNASNPHGRFAWDPDALVAFVIDCAANGVRAVSFGGGEPLEYEPLFDVLARLRGILFRSLTTNGLLLTEAMLARLVDAGADKVHVSVHFPSRAREVERVIGQVHALERAGIRSGVNLLVARSELGAAAHAACALRDAGIGNERIVYLPKRGDDTPSPAEVARVAGGTQRFQSMTCLAACAKSERFCSVAADASVAWCSYTTTRRKLAARTHAALLAALDGLGLDFCGGAHGGLVRLSRRALDGHGVVRGGP